MPPYYYYWQENASEDEYSILRIHCEGQIHLDDHIAMLSALDGAYMSWCQLYRWTESAGRDSAVAPFGDSRLRYLEKLLRRRSRLTLDPNYEDLVVFLLASRLTDSGLPLSEAVSSVIVEPRNLPVLHRCVLNSPGSIDIAGVGKVLEVLKDWISGRGLRKAKERETNARARKTEAEARAQELENIQAEFRLANEFRNTAHELGYSPNEIQHVLSGDMTNALQALNPSVDRGQISRAEIIPLDHPDQRS